MIKSYLMPGLGGQGSSGAREKKHDGYIFLWFPSIYMLRWWQAE
jgi:hypothetical protein